MGMMEIIHSKEELISRLNQRLSAHRFIHTLNVAQEAEKLAKLYHVNTEDAIVAGLLHDYARELPDEELLRLAQEDHWPLNPVEKEIPMLLHGPVAAYLVKRDLGITDPSILQAIRFHTTGCGQMDDLAKIVFLADMLEPSRNFPGVKELRQLAYHDLNRALLKCLEHTLLYVIERGRLLHPLTVEARNALLFQLQQKGEG